MVYSSFCHMLSSMKMCCTLWSKGSTQNGFPPRMEKVLLAHLEKTTERAGKEKNPEKVDVSNRCIPLKVVLKSSQALDRAQVLVQASFAITSGHTVLISCQHDSPLITADLPQRHVHFQLKHKQKQELTNKSHEGTTTPSHLLCLTGFLNLLEGQTVTQPPQVAQRLYAPTQGAHELFHLHLWKHFMQEHR